MNPEMWPSWAEMQKEGNNNVCLCVCTRGLRSQAWADGPQRCYHTVSGHCDWCIATSKKVEHLAADPQSELIGPAFSLFSCCERADGWFGQNKHTLGTRHFPTLKGACISCTLETSPSSLQGGHEGGAGRGGWAHGALETDRDGTVKPRVTVLHLDGEDLTLSLFWGGLLVKQLHMTWFLQVTCNNSSSLNFIYVAQYYKFASRGFTICSAYNVLYR